MTAHQKTPQAFTPQMIIPPGWVWIPLKGDRKAVVQELFQDAWNSGPLDSIGPFIHRIENVMLKAVNQAYDVGGIAIVMPLGTPWHVAVSTSIALSMFQTETSTLQLPPGEVLETEAGPAVLKIVDNKLPENAEQDDLVLLRTLELTWVTPDKSSYLLATATISGVASEEFTPVTAALTTLITTMLSAMTWTEVAS